jgi:inner membrane protein
MNVLIHALMALAVARVVMPRAPRAAWGVVIIAGTVADLDVVSASLGPGTYLTWHHTYTHSVVAAFVAVAVLAIGYVLLAHGPVTLRAPVVLLWTAGALAACSHLALDACASEGITPLWPFSERRIAADWLASVDPWIFAILMAALLLPELLHLVSAEIGSKEKGPRGRVGAIIGIAFVILYVGLRATLHSNVVATMQARTYRGELPRRAAAFPESASLFTWHGIVETESALDQLTVNAAPGASFDPESNITLFKPESSPLLDRARDSDAAKLFLRVARFPKATVEKTRDGSQVQIRDLRYAAAGETSPEIEVVVKLDAKGNVAEDSLVWERNLRHR